MRSGQLAGAAGILVAVSLISAACAPVTAPPATRVVSHETEALLERDADVPSLPFADNPDPTQCGIPIQWGLDDPAFLSGYYEGRLVQPEVFLYDSHLRLSITGAAPTGSRVRILLYQQNPVLNFYMVESLDLDSPQKGWVPAPFIQFEAPE